jgi:hypothetical protein
MTDPRSGDAETTMHARVIPADPVKERPTRAPLEKRKLWSHPAGPPILCASAVITAFGFAPLLLDKLEADVVQTAADVSTHIAPPWPSGTDPTLWPPAIAAIAWFTAAIAIITAVTGLKVPKIVPLVLAGILTATTAFAAWSTFDVVNTENWYLLPPCALSIVAFGLAARGLLRWRSTGYSGLGGNAVSTTLLGWALTLGVLIAGTAIVTESLEDSATNGGVQPAFSTQLSLDGLRTEGAPTLDTLRGWWVPQIASAQIHDQSGADAYLAKNQEWMARFPVIVVRGGDFPSNTLSTEDWMTLVPTAFGSEAEVQAWCASNRLGPNDCLPRQIPG